MKSRNPQIATRPASGRTSAATARIRATVLRGILILAAFTFVVDMLLLVQPLYMLQIYDRIIPSRSLDTLIFLSLIAVGALLLLGALEALRGMIASRLAAQIDVVAGSDTFRAALAGQGANLGDVQPLRDLAAVRSFLGGRTLFAFLDLPFAPIFIGLLYFIHPNLFWLTLIGAVVLALLALANQRASDKLAAETSSGQLAAINVAQAFARNSESVQAMGMSGNAIHVWGQYEADVLKRQEQLNRTSAAYTGLSRFLRLGLQIAILGYGGYLVVLGEMTAGMIFASSLISSRGLQPIDQIIAGWRSFVDMRKTWDRLQNALNQAPRRLAPTELPAPEGNLTIDHITVFPPTQAPADPILRNINATIPAGECLVVLGESGAGKSTLVRALVGSLSPRAGAVRLDGSDIRHWDRDRLGQHIGYLSQDVELLPGSIARNISRFLPDADDNDIVTAARKAHVHDLIAKLPHGYDTAIGPGGYRLSGGQKTARRPCPRLFRQPSIADP